MESREPIIIYVIFHHTLEDVNLFTTDKNKIHQLIQKKTDELNEQFKSIGDKVKVEDWRWRELTEEVCFGADMTCY